MANFAFYPSHDWESGIAENDNGDHFNMKDYHVYSMDDVMNGEITDHEVVLYGKYSLGGPSAFGTVMLLLKTANTICIFHWKTKMTYSVSGSCER